MNTVLEKKLVRDLYGEIVATDYVPVLKACIDFANECFRVDLDVMEIGDCDGNMLYGLVPCGGRELTEVEQATIAGFHWCSIHYAEVITPLRVEYKLDAILAGLGLPPVQYSIKANRESQEKQKLDVVAVA